jgi:hypothetical protein
MKIQNVQMYGLDCLQIKNSACSLTVTHSIGPRVLQLQMHGRENLFAEVPEITILGEGGAPYRLWGGHRLWHAPEVPERTYLPDDLPVSIEETPASIILAQPIETVTGVRKIMQISMPDDKALVVIDHFLQNMGSWPVELSPWAITMVPLGGVAILPQNIHYTDKHGLLPNRNVVIWPYTDINNPWIHWGNSAIFIEAAVNSGALKLGFTNPRGWLGYYHDSTLFVKKTLYRAGAKYPDMGCSSEVYCNTQFMELETLAPLMVVEPGKMVAHREIWELFDMPDFEMNEAWVLRMEKHLMLSRTSKDLRNAIANQDFKTEEWYNE